MRKRLSVVLSVVFAMLLLAATITGCQQQQGEQPDGNGATQEEETSPTAQGLELETVTQWAESAHSRPVVFAAEEEGCKNCHDGLTFTETGGGFMPRIATGTADATGSAGASATVGAEAESEERDWVVAADCRTCHSGAGAEIAAEGSIEGIPNLQTAEGGLGALCMSCHNGWHEAGEGREGNMAAPHYSIQADMMFAVNTLTVGEGSGDSTATAGEEDLLSPHNDVEDTCVGCHMRGGDGEVSHTFRIENTEGCERSGCHDENMADGGDAEEDYDGDGTTEKFQIEVEGLLETLRAAVNESAGSSEFVAQGGDVVFTGGNATVDSAAYKAAYNYFYVDKDSSRGIHNPNYTIKVLQDSIAGLRGGN